MSKKTEEDIILEMMDEIVKMYTDGDIHRTEFYTRFVELSNELDNIKNNTRAYDNAMKSIDRL